MFQNDFIKRAIDQTASLLASIARHKNEGELEEAQAEISEAYAKLLRIDRVSFDAVDSHTAAGLVGPAEAIRNVARLCVMEAELYDEAGQPGRARAKWRRGLELLLEAHAAEPADGDGAEIDALLAIVPREALAPRYRA